MWERFDIGFVIVVWFQASDNKIKDSKEKENSQANSGRVIIFFVVECNADGHKNISSNKNQRKQRVQLHAENAGTI
jgi:hypothetical protein